MTVLNWILLYLVLSLVYTMHAWEKEKDEIPLSIALILFWIYPILDFINWIRFHYIRISSIILLRRIRRKLKRENKDEHKETIQTLTEVINEL